MPSRIVSRRSACPPGQATVEVVAGGALPLRLRVADDFGVARVAFVVRDARDEGPAILGADLATRPITGTATLPNGSPHEVLASTRIGGGAVRGEHIRRWIAQQRELLPQSRFEPESSDVIDALAAAPAISREFGIAIDAPPVAEHPPRHQIVCH